MAKQIGKYNRKTGRVDWFEVDQVTKEIHYVQGDEIPPTISHATDEGKVFTSWSKLQQHYKEHGYECTGGAHLTGRGVADWKYKANVNELRADILEAKRQLEWGMAPLTEREKELCQREERSYQDYKRRQSR